MEAVITAKREEGTNSILMSHDFGMRCSTSRCPHTFGHVVYLAFRMTVN
jgi:hypothetical protein